VLDHDTTFEAMSFDRSLSQFRMIHMASA
jgi:hypothetical protein